MRKECVVLLLVEGCTKKILWKLDLRKTLGYTCTSQCSSRLAAIRLLPRLTKMRPNVFDESRCQQKFQKSSRRFSCCSQRFHAARKGSLLLPCFRRHRFSTMIPSAPREEKGPSCIGIFSRINRKRSTSQSYGGSLPELT